MSTIRGTGISAVTPLSSFLDSSEYAEACIAKTKRKKFFNNHKTLSASKIPISFHYSDWNPTKPAELSEIISFTETEAFKHSYITNKDKNPFLLFLCDYPALVTINDPSKLKWNNFKDDTKEEILATLTEQLESPIERKRHSALLCLQYLLLGALADSKDNKESRTQNSLAIGRLLLTDFSTLVNALKLAYRCPNSLFCEESQENITDTPNITEIGMILNIIYIVLESNRESTETAEIAAESEIAKILLEILTEQPNLNQLVESIPVKKTLLVFHKSLSISFGEFFSKEKTENAKDLHKNDLKSRAEHLNEHKEILSSFRFHIPGAIQEATKLLSSSLHEPYPGIFHAYSSSEDEIGENLFFSQFCELVKSFFQHEQSFVSNLLCLLYAAAPHTNTSQEDSLNISAGINCWKQFSLSKLQKIVEEERHKDIIFKSVSGILITMLKYLRVFDLFVYRHFCDLLDSSNCIAVILSTINCELATKFVYRENQAPELEYFGASPIYMDDVLPNEDNPYKPCTWRNMFALMSLLKVLKKVTHRNPVRERALVKCKALVISKRSILVVSHPVIELYTLKMLKPLIKYLNSRWRSSNFPLISKIALKVPQDLVDDWILPLDVSQSTKTAENQDKLNKEKTSNYLQQNFPTWRKKQ